MEEQEIRFTYVPVNGIRLHVAEAGPPDGRPVILLHGFPEFWYGWRKQITALAAAGLRVIAPDQRGYNLSDKPEWLVGYRLETLIQDVTGLMDHYGWQKAVIAGHDWGGGVAWGTALARPERVERLIAINTAPPQVMVRHARRHPSQALKSLYILGFQVPLLPEWIWRQQDFRRGTNALLSTSRPGTFSSEDLALYKAAWDQPGAQTAMLNWYRASLRYPFRTHLERVTAPTLILWGARDAFLNRGLAEESARICEYSQIEYFEDATHWVQHEEAGGVNKAMLGFLNPS